MLADILELIADELALIPGLTVKGDDGKALVGVKHIEAHGTHPRIVFVPIARESHGVTATQTSAQNPKTLQTSSWQIAARCWGADLATCERLEQAVFTAIRNKVVQGADVFHIRTEPLEDESAVMRDGYVLVVLLRIQIPMPEGASGALADFTLPTVTIESVDFDPTPAVVGDGNLNLGET